MKRLAALSVLATLLVTSCQDMPTQQGLEDMTPLASISDAVHEQGNVHFYFLPPMVTQPTHTGSFDGSVEPVVEICVGHSSQCDQVIATYTMETGPGSETVRVVPEDEHYIVNWHTDAADPGNYRIRVLVRTNLADTELGHADVVLDSNKELKNVETDEYVPLKDGRTLPIKFRIEHGAVFLVGSEAATVSACDGVVTLDVPAGALTDFVGITVQPVTDYLGDPVPGTVFDFGPDGLVFFELVTLTIEYDEDSLPPETDESLLRLHKLVGDEWEPVSGSRVDTESNTVSGEVDGFSTFAALSRPKMSPGLDVGGVSTCVLASDGQAYCWGSKVAPGALTPQLVPGGHTWLAIATGRSHACGVTTSNRIYCWGENDQGQLGIGYLSNEPEPPTQVPGFTFQSVIAGGYHTCGRENNGDWYCWGSTGFGELGNGEVGGEQSGNPNPQLVTVGDFEALAPAADYTCGLTAGELYCWGMNYGPTAQYVGAFESVEGTQAGITCAVTSSGEGYCWGGNGYGQLGAGWFSGQELEPTLVTGGHTWETIASGGKHTCGRTTDGDWYCWGRNRYGTVGNGFMKPGAAGRNHNYSTPQLLTVGIFESAQAGWNHTCGVTAGGEVYCWGDGPLGDGADHYTPIPRGVILDLDPTVQVQGCVAWLEGPLGWWAGNTGGGGAAHDNMWFVVDVGWGWGLAHFGRYKNGATYSEGMVNMAFHFDGVDDYVQVPGEGTDPFTNDDFASGVTLEAWFKTSSDDHNQTIVDIEGWVNLIVGLDVSLPQLSYPSKLAGTTDGGSNFVVAEGAPDVTDGEWHHAAIVYDPAAAAAQRMVLYLDGFIVDEGPINGPPSPDSHNRPLTIGVHSSSQEPGAWFFEGDVDEVVLYDRALSASEVQDIFNAGSWGRCMPPPTTP